ncbi:MAG: hypothetical protein WD749_15445 [Phycisphaerales bacterium]
MAEIPTYEQWMKDTYSLTSPRSEYLQKLDAALKDLSEKKPGASKDAVKFNFDRWRFKQRKQGKNWTKSVRNERGAMTNLYRALDLDKRKLTREEIEAMKFIAHHQATALQRQFLGAKLAFKSSTLVGMAQRASTKWERFKAGAESVDSARGTIGDIKEGAEGVKSGIDLLKTGGKAGATAASKAAMSKQFSEIRAKVIDLCKEPRSRAGSSSPTSPPARVDPARIVGFGVLAGGRMGQHVMKK